MHFGFSSLFQRKRRELEVSCHVYKFSRQKSQHTRIEDIEEGTHNTKFRHPRTQSPFRPFCEEKSREARSKDPVCCNNMKIYVEMMHEEDIKRRMRIEENRRLPEFEISVEMRTPCILTGGYRACQSNAHFPFFE
jgi:hypothetical protein